MRSRGGAARACPPLLHMLSVVSMLAACSSAASGGTSAPPAVNIAIIVADDLGTYDLSVMGHPSIRTPFLDQLAAEGALFTQWLSAAPICTPSRSSLYTGRLPIRTGLYADMVPTPDPEHPHQGNGTFGLDAWMKKDGAGGLPSTEVTLPELLKDHRSLLCGKWHLGQINQYWPRQHGFDNYLGTLSTHDHGKFNLPNGTKSPFPCTVVVRDDKITHRLTNGNLASPENLSPPGWPAAYPADGGGPDPTRAAAECSIANVSEGGDGALPFGVDELIPLYTNETTSFIRSSIAAKKPFLMVYTPDNTHLPAYASSAFLGKSQRGLYGDAVEELDWSVGQILAAIEPVKNNTFVVFSSDNGAQGGGGNNGCQGLFRCMKGTTWEGGFREPGIVRFPPLLKPGQRLTQLVSTMDIFVTVLELTGVEAPANRPLDGKSLVPLMKDSSAESGHSDYFYWRGNAVFAMRHGDFKLHFYTQGCTDYWLPARTQHDPPLIFHMLRDPAEAYPLNATLPENVVLIAGARAALAAHLKEVEGDETKGTAQLNECNVAAALWPEAQRRKVQPADRKYMCAHPSDDPH